VAISLERDRDGMGIFRLGILVAAVVLGREVAREMTRGRAPESQKPAPKRRRVASPAKRVVKRVRRKLPSRA
jgi:hypothetical protein